MTVTACKAFPLLDVSGPAISQCIAADDRTSRALVASKVWSPPATREASVPPRERLALTGHK